MTILSMTDIEGVTNVDDYEMVRTNSGEDYEEGSARDRGLFVASILGL